jgi:hypothetical protein
VLLYGSEVWGTSMVNKINKEERFLFNLSKNMKQENVHIKFCKFSLSVGKRTTNIVVLGENLDILLNIYIPFALSIGTLFTLNILSWSFPVLLNTTDLVFFIFIWRPHFVQ